MFDNYLMEENHIYIAIDLKSFYASVECVERGLDALTTNLVVADSSRTDKTICLAVSPSLKSYGIPGRPRLFEVIQKVDSVNQAREKKAPGRKLTGKSYDYNVLNSDPSMALDYIVAPPRMSMYMEYSTKIFKTYLKYISADDIHVYSCDEVFMDVTKYLNLYKISPRELAETMVHDVLATTGITATVGIGTNLFLCKVAMDIVAKHIDADENGVRIAELDEMSFRRTLWDHRPLSDFWRIGYRTQKHLEKMGIYTLGELARYSEKYEDGLYKEFGVNAELLIDHAWGWEPCTIDYIKQYKPMNNSLGNGQVLTRGYSNEEAAIVIREMADNLALHLVAKRLVTNQVIINVGYEHITKKNLVNADPAIELALDRYSRIVPKGEHGSKNLKLYTSSGRLITEAVVSLFYEITDPNLQVRRLNVTANNVIYEEDIPESKPVQLSFFDDNNDIEIEEELLKKEKNLQLATLEIKERFGKNALLKGTDFLEGATARERNQKIGGHKA